MRTSNDEIKDGVVWNGYDYNLQVWVLDGVIQGCSHPRGETHGNCPSYTLRNQRIDEVKGHEVRS